MADVPLPAPGTLVDLRAHRWRVVRARRDRAIARLDLARGDLRRVFLIPFDRPRARATGERGRRLRRASALRQLAALVARAGPARLPASLVDSAADVLPFQIEPALALEGGARRVLVADEVGLGKTVQAGLAIAERVRRDPDARVLVLAPAGLHAQWALELARWFDLRPRSGTRDGLDRTSGALAFGTDSWRRPGVTMASLDYLKQPHVLASLPLQAWDLVVVDEAHDACGDSARYHACADLARRSRRLLLLTATPHTGEASRFRRLLRLGAHGARAPAPLVFRRSRADLRPGVTRAVRWHRVALTATARAMLEALAAFEHVVQRARAGRADSGTTAGPANQTPGLLLALLRKRALSTAHAFCVSIDHRLAWLDARGTRPDDGWRQPSLIFAADAADDGMSAGDQAAITMDIGLDEARERSWMRRLRQLGHAARRHDAKVRRVAGLLARAREPAIVFTEFRDSLEAIAGVLGRSRVAVLHGGQSAPERTEALRAFDAGAARVLLATDVASQGLNLQRRCRWVINLELPWVPARLEQRAGRVDRLGQRRRPHVTLVVARHPWEGGLLSRLAERVLCAQRALGPHLLAHVLPSDAAVRACLLEDTPLPEATAAAVPRVPACTRYRGAAIAAARSVTWRRALLQRAGGFRHDCGWTALVPGASLRRRAGPRAVAVFTVPLVDHRADTIEEHVVPVLCPVADDGRRLAPARVVPATREQARAIAADSLRRRAARLTRRAVREAREAAVIDGRIAAHCRRIAHLDRWQPGLFDRRREREVAARDEELADAGLEIAAPVDATGLADAAPVDAIPTASSSSRARHPRVASGAARDSPAVVVGRPRLRLVLGARC